MNATTYAHNRVAHFNATMHYSAGTATITHEGRQYTQTEFDQAFPVEVIKIEPDSKYGKDANPDTSKHWLV